MDRGTRKSPVTSALKVLLEEWGGGDDCHTGEWVRAGEEAGKGQSAWGKCVGKRKMTQHFGRET